MSTIPTTCRIETWQLSHPRWEEMLAFAASVKQPSRVAFHAPFHRTTHMLVALGEAQQIVGFIR